MGRSGPGLGVGGSGVGIGVGVGDGGIRVGVAVGVGGVGVGVEIAVAVGAEVGVGGTGVEAACVCATADVAARATFVLLICAFSCSRVAFALFDCPSSYSCTAIVAANWLTTVADLSRSFANCLLCSAYINRTPNITSNR